ncbi:MAG: hypothetical protein LBR26_16145, partial [Prevotella sp.]|nr:hypothetical protein [Prevotella sp.]
PDDRPDLADKVSLRGDDAIDVSGVTGINEGLARGAFYLWPGKLDGRDNLTDESTLIEVEGIYIGDSKPVVYKVLLAGDRPIEANKRYILTVSRIDRTNLVFALEVSQWDNEEEEMRAVPSVDAVEYTGFSLDNVAIPDGDGEDIDIDLSDNTGDSELRFSTLSENRATDELTATLDFILGTDYAKNNFTPVVEGDPVVTYGGAKVRQTYKIILPKTTYPVKGTLTVKDEVTTKMQTFNITSVPKYENTDYTPVLVEGQYSEDGPADERRYWAPVNVGATLYNTTSSLEASGYYFQWGRNVPFVFDSADDKQLGPVSATNASGIYATRFIYTESPGDWLIPDDKNDDLWSGENAQGPCPDGWRVPTGTELTVLESNINGATSENPVTVTGVGGNLFLPAAGYRNSGGSWTNRTTHSRYWSSSVSGASAYALFISPSGREVSSSPRAYGYSVRCIQK